MAQQRTAPEIMEVIPIRAQTVEAIPTMRDNRQGKINERCFSHANRNMNTSMSVGSDKNRQRENASGDTNCRDNNHRDIKVSVEKHHTPLLPPQSSRASSPNTAPPIRDTIPTSLTHAIGKSLCSKRDPALDADLDATALLSRPEGNDIPSLIMARCPHSEETKLTHFPTTRTATRDESDGLRPPSLIASGEPVTGRNKNDLRKQNKAQRTQALLQQPEHSNYWTELRGDFFIPDDLPPATEHRNKMCPSGLALSHPAGETLQSWAKLGCPTMTGTPWTREQMQCAIDRGPHASALMTEALKHFADEIQDKLKAGQARTVLWDDIKDNPPDQLKISPIAAIPHKSKPFRSILDLWFSLKLNTASTIPSVNESTTKTAPSASIDQLGHSLSRLIHAVATVEEDAKIFMAKWDIKDGFWRLDCQDGEEYNFAYVLPQPEGSPTVLVIPTSLQMGWIESPGFFCAASETSQDVVTQYCQAPVGLLPVHKFDHYMRGSEAFQELPHPDEISGDGRYLIEVFVDDFMSLVIATAQQQVIHVGTATMMGIHDVFPQDDIPQEDPISEKKLLKNEGQFDTTKTLLGFNFDGVAKTIWLEPDKRAALLLILK